MALPRIGMLWMEGPLSYLEQLCIVSFRDAGHDVVLYHYGEVLNVPDGIARADAASILPRDGGDLTHARTGSPALHSDLFRYRLLKAEPGMIWADTDAYCLRPFETRDGHFYGWESDRHVNGGVLGLPADSATLAALLEFTSDVFAIPPWYDEAAQQEYRAAAAAGTPVHAGEMRWGVWGPHALTHFLQATGEIAHAFPRHVLYPFTFQERRKMLQRGFDTSGHLLPDTRSIHFYGRRMRKRLVEAEGGIPPRWSLLGRLLATHGIDPVAAPIPVAAPVDEIGPASSDDAGETQELVTLAVIAYNQEAVVRDAIEGAFSQVHQPLEILLSDDGSSDGTFAIMQEMAAAYDGPHRVRLNRNPRNLGLIGHVNTVFELAEGVLIVPNAGDDISLPDRCAEMYRAYRRTRAPLLYSDTIAIARDGTPIGKRSRKSVVEANDTIAAALRGRRSVIGASCAWGRALYEVFGPIVETGAYEDSVLYGRARLLGQVDHVPLALVKYRQGGHSRGDESLEWRLRRAEVSQAVLRQRRRDIDRFARWITAEVDDELSSIETRLARLREKIVREAGASDQTP
ncbi:glycosyltransferase [Palleronia sp. KMU-117]|uniref:glycosyltransferase n=1 Tax=Palleronia sp. KMU-117 TaxID=3434108 RepID=UPI003D74EA69